MFEIYETQYDYNIDNIFADGNLIGEILKTRGGFAQNPMNYEIKENRLITTFNNRSFIWMRKENIDKYKTEKIDDIIYFYTPLLNKEENKGKENSRFILHTGTLCVGFWLSHPIIDEAANYMLNNPDTSSKEYLKYKYINDNIALCPAVALHNILSLKLENVKFIGNDIEINNKKVAGSSHMQNFSGVHVQMGINYDYDEQFFKTILSEDEFHRKTKQGITSIKQEIPNYTREEFVYDFKNEVQRLIKSVKAFNIEF